MIERMAAFFPFEFTVFAEWGVCTLHILCNDKRLRGWKAFALILGAFPLLLVLNYAHFQQPAPIWLSVMLCCLVTMMLYLRLGLKEHISVVVQHWCQAVMQAEFSAALAYLVTVYLRVLEIFEPAHTGGYLLVMLLVYAVVFTPLGFLLYRQARRKERPLKYSHGEVVSSLFITMVAFAISNISFWAPSSIFGIDMGGGVLLVRTVADFSGMIALLATNETSYAMQLRMNVNMLKNIVNNQYIHYQQFKVNNDHMQQVYHDIKHLIHYIRSVSNSQKYEPELQNMEGLVSQYEAQYDTGNSVLDVVLCNKKMLCISENITMECYVDAREMDFMNEVHICTIFGNALDNAIEYERGIEETEKRLMKVSVCSENHFVVINISNYCEQPVQISLEAPKSTKKNPEMHGYGIKGIRLTVENYGGHMSIKQANNWVVMSILIPIPEHRGQASA